MVARLFLKVTQKVRHIDIVSIAFSFSLTYNSKASVNVNVSRNKLNCLPIPIILRCDILILLDSPREREVFKAQFLALINKLCTPLPNLENSNQFRRNSPPFLAIIPETRYSSRMVVVLDKNTTLNRTTTWSAGLRGAKVPEEANVRIPEPLITFVSLPVPNDALHL